MRCPASRKFKDGCPSTVPARHGPAHPNLLLPFLRGLVGVACQPALANRHWLMTRLTVMFAPWWSGGRYFVEPIVTEVFDKLQHVWRRLAPKERGKFEPNHGDAVMVTRIELVCMTHHRSVTDLTRAHAEHVEAVTVATALGETAPEPFFGGLPWAEAGFNWDRHRAMMRLLVW